MKYFQWLRCAHWVLNLKCWLNTPLSSVALRTIVFEKITVYSDYHKNSAANQAILFAHENLAFCVRSFVESKAGNLSCSRSTTRFSNATIRKKAPAQDAKFSCAESIIRLYG